MGPSVLRSSIFSTWPSPYPGTDIQVEETAVSPSWPLVDGALRDSGMEKKKAAVRTARVAHRSEKG